MDDPRDVKSLLPNSAGASRLASFKAPRDLTLSLSPTKNSMNPQIGLSRPKKTFMPNIKIKREKTNHLLESKSEKSLKKAPLKGHRHDRGKFIKKEKEFIQTQGSLFGEGIAVTSLKRQNYVGGSKGGSGKDQAYIHKPVFSHDAASDKDVEEKKLRELLRDDFIEDPDDGLDFRLCPIQLPMISTTKVFKDETQLIDDVDVKNVSKKLLDVRIKEEPVEAQPDDLKKKPVQLNDLNRKSVAGGSESVLPETNSDEFMFLQLPSCLPGHPSEVKQEPAFYNSLPKKSTSMTNNTGSYANSQQQCNLSSLPEGKIGTVKIYKSGKTELWLGDHIMTIRRGTEVGFLQEVISMAVDKETKTGAMTVLGHIKHRLVCTPDFDNMAKSKDL